MPNPVTETEVIDFLARKLNMQIATIDEEGSPMIHTILFMYDKGSDKIYANTQKMSKKGQNILRNPDQDLFFN
jgi:nitroimidazol reductase NimA-like FMN-containing flavoprotein (pyridoxamine 5'-phosphate oxidase superfamily)